MKRNANTEQTFYRTLTIDVFRRFDIALERRVIVSLRFRLIGPLLYRVRSFGKQKEGRCFRRLGTNRYR